MRALLLVVMALWGLAACSERAAEPLSIVSSPWPGYEPLYLARDLGYLEPSISIKEMPSSNITWEAFSNGSADIATLTLDETLSLVAKGRKVRVLSVMDISNGGDVVMARPEIKTLADLKGKRIGITNIPLGVYMLKRTLEVAGLQPEDVEVIPLPEDKHPRAYADDRFDAVITFEPFKSEIEGLGGHVLFDSSRIPYEIFDLIIVREAVYRERREELCGIVNQFYRTHDYTAANRDDAYTRMGRRLGVDAAGFGAMMEGLIVPDREENRHLLGGEEPAIIAPAKRLAAIMLQENMLPGAVDPREILDPDFQNCIE